MTRIALPGILAAFLFLLLGSCTNIEVEEEMLFDVKRTIRPSHFEGEDVPAELEEVRFSTSDGLELEGWYIRSPGAGRTVLYVGGNGFVIASSYHILTSIYQQGVDLLVFDYRGYGRNPGSPSFEGIQLDTEAAYRYLRNERGVAPEELIIHGHSIGTLPATELANSRPAAALVLESPVTEARHMSRRFVPALLRPFVNLEFEQAVLEKSNLREVPKVKIPLLLIVGSEDNITPKELAEELYERATVEEKRLEILEGGDHNDLPRREDYRRILREFYRRR
jgi:dipeptidyl aminopeptidase/acylaminoacyl peptidase